jgi:hypothetical protein
MGDRSDRVIPIPLREGIYAFVDLPHDLTAAEADKVCRVIKAMAVREQTPARAAGGHARAEALSPERRSEIARDAANKRWSNQ